VTSRRLTRIDPEKNMARFYFLDLQPTLFGGFALMRAWGRIGQGGQLRSEFFDAEDDARIAMERLLRTKTRRGYRG
jgi:predicted DNA-binding WGR domain protein